MATLSLALSDEAERAPLTLSLSLSRSKSLDGVRVFFWRKRAKAKARLKPLTSFFSNLFQPKNKVSLFCEENFAATLVSDPTGLEALTLDSIFIHFFSLKLAPFFILKNLELPGWLAGCYRDRNFIVSDQNGSYISKVPIDAILFSHENNLFEFVKICNSNAFRSMTKVTLVTSVVACCGENVLQSRLRNVVDVINGHFNQACRTCTLPTVQSTGLSKYFCFFAKNMSVFLYMAVFLRRGGGIVLKMWPFCQSKLPPESVVFRFVSPKTLLLLLYFDWSKIERVASQKLN